MDINYCLRDSRNNECKIYVFQYEKIAYKKIFLHKIIDCLQFIILSGSLLMFQIINFIYTGNSKILLIIYILLFFLTTRIVFKIFNKFIEQKKLNYYEISKKEDIKEIEDKINEVINRKKY